MQKEKEKRHFRFSVSRICVIVLSGLTLGLCLYFLITSVFAGDKMPMPFGFGAGVVLSGSMEPELSVNDVIILHSEASYQVGDVVVYSSGRSVVVHRIVDVSGSDITTKGDANNTEDDPIILSDINGKVIFSIPGAGNVVAFLRSPLGVICVLCFAFLLLELSFNSEKRRGECDIERLRKEINELKKSSDPEGNPDDPINN